MRIEVSIVYGDDQDRALALSALAPVPMDQGTTAVFDETCGSMIEISNTEPCQDGV